MASLPCQGGGRHWASGRTRWRTFCPRGNVREMERQLGPRKRRSVPGKALPFNGGQLPSPPPQFIERHHLSSGPLNHPLGFEVASSCPPPQPGGWESVEVKKEAGERDRGWGRGQGGGVLTPKSGILRRERCVSVESSAFGVQET